MDVYIVTGNDNREVEYMIICILIHIAMFVFVKVLCMFIYFKQLTTHVVML